MKDVQIARVSLLGTLRSNRAQHEKDYDAAVEGWKIEYVEKLRKELRQAEAGAFIVPYHGTGHIMLNLPQKPVSHLADYDRAITMLGHEIREEILLDEGDFRRYVLDDWDWKEEFLNLSTQYRNTAREHLTRRG